MLGSDMQSPSSDMLLVEQVVAHGCHQGWDLASTYLPHPSILTSPGADMEYKQLNSLYSNTSSYS